MKVIKSIGLILLVLLLLVSIVSASNHSASFWRFVKRETSPYLYMYEDFSEITWSKCTAYDGTDAYMSQSDVIVIPRGGSFSTDGESLTVYNGEALGKILQIKIPYDNLNAKENFDLDKLSYFVVTYELCTDTLAPQYLLMRPYVFNEYNSKTFVGSDFASLSYSDKYTFDSCQSSTFTFADKIAMATSTSNRDRICCVLAVDPVDVSKSTVSYYVNGAENELTYTDWITEESEYISQFELTFKSSYSSSISIDNFSVYVFDREFKGDIKDVLKEVNYK